MNYKRVIPSLVIGLGGVVLLSVGLIHVMKIGTCASGNTPYVIANPCPSGTGGYIFMIVAASSPPRPESSSGASGARA